MSYVGEFIGGPCDGRLEAFPSVPEYVVVALPPPLNYVADLQDVTNVPQIRELRYVRRRGMDGELWYVWDRLVKQ